jgi:asparagine synthase (glutamine-hydrolysing)
MGSLVLVTAPSAPPDSDVARRALGAAPHRGSRQEVHVCGNVILGVSNDPDFEDAWIATANGTAAVLAGTLENRAELDRELRSPLQVDDDNPAGTVIRAFAAWGEDAPTRFRGAFTGAVTDGGRTFVFRDQLGFRTLFFRDEPTGFLAATEGKQVAAAAGIPRAPDIEAAEAIFFGRLPERRTALKGVERFPKTSVATISPEETRFRQYWDPSELLETQRISVPEACEVLAQLLDQAVGRAVTGEDAIALSGGLDSPTVAALAAPKHLERGGRPLAALSAVYPQLPTVDERAYTELVAKHLSLPLHTYVQQTSPLDDLAFWTELADGPWDALPISWAAERNQLARALGARTLLTGDMLEYAATMWGNLFGHLVFHGKWRAAAAWAADRRARGRPWRRVIREATRSLAPSFVASPYVRLRRKHFARRDRALMPSWLDEAPFGGFGQRPVFDRPARRRWLESQLDPLRSSPWTSFEAADICAGYCGIQVRRPLADIDLWEFFLSLPAETKFPDLLPKRLIREAMRGRLPDAVIDRRDKTIFDEHALASADYPGLRRWLLGTQHRVEGVDYALLESQLEGRAMGVTELLWAYNLARVHAFLAGWE